MTTRIRDLTDAFGMPADTHAGLYKIQGGYYVAWGIGDGATAVGERWDAPNTLEHGVERFDDLCSAETYIDNVTACYFGGASID